jgi:hypothetical protein
LLASVGYAVTQSRIDLSPNDRGRQQLTNTRTLTALSSRNNFIDGGGKFPQGLKPGSFCVFAARLKSCPSRSRRGGASEVSPFPEPDLSLR